MAAERLRPDDPAGVPPPQADGGGEEASGGTPGGGAGRLPAHHPSDASLAAYAGGTLGELTGFVVAAHLASCPACRRTVRTAEAVGGVLMDGLPPAQLAPDALQRALARLDAPAGAASFGGEASGSWSTAGGRAGRGVTDPASGALPIALPAVLGGLPVRPFRWVAPGVHWAGILRRPDGMLGLLRVRPGTALPLHSHRGQEMTVVLDGAYDGSGGRFEPGDCEEADEDVAHDQAATGGRDCVCLVATGGRLRFRTPLSRLWQPFMPF